VVSRILRIGLIALAFAVWALAPALASHLTVRSSDIVDRAILNRDIGTDQVDRRVIAPGTIQRAEINSQTLSSFQNFPVRRGVTVRGVIGGDFEGHSATPSEACPDNCDWGVTASLPFPAPVGLSDDEVFVDVTLCDTDCTGVTVDADEVDAATTCTGTIAAPTAPPGVVCIYVAGADNAVNVEGFSVLPGTGASRYGFKLGWDSTAADDTFIDAVWAYTSP
jgi:hypothetical protein